MAAGDRDRRPLLLHHRQQLFQPRGWLGITFINVQIDAAANVLSQS